MCFAFICDPGGGRTYDPQIKRLLLYQLSYEVIVATFLTYGHYFVERSAKIYKISNSAIQVI